MRFNSILALLAVGTTSAVSQSLSTEFNPTERLNANDSALLVVDHQVGLFSIVRDWDPAVFKQNLIAHAALGKLFNLPVVITTSTETGPNGRVPKEILDLFPDVQVVKRLGEVNAWDDPNFREAVRATGKKQLIIGGIATDVCTALLALSLRSEGYSVFANVEASGTFSTLIRDTANLRMQAAGVHLVSSFAILGELMRDWRTPFPGIRNVVPWIDAYLPAYGAVARIQASALLQNGTVLEGSEQFI